MTKKSQRAASLILALIFLASTLVFTGAVIWQLISDNGEQTTTQTTTTEARMLENFDPIANVDSLQKIDLQEGSGQVVKESDTITVHYTGALAATGEIFESSKDTGQPVTFGLNQVIEGWTKGIPGTKVGGTRRLIIPANLAYGAQSPSPDIPPNSALVFDVEVIAIQ